MGSLMRPSNLLALVSVLLLSVGAVHGQSGFLSIDCGKPAGYNYTSVDRGIQYVSDSGYIDTGENHKIPISYQSSETYSQAFDLRSFPNGTRNCYTLPVVSGNRYLIRSFFMYGNYDGKNRVPKFDWYVDMFRWGTITAANASINYYIEMLVVASSNYMSACVVDIGSGEPFISALELRELPDKLYQEVNSSIALSQVSRINFGASNDNAILRYKTDAYDRLWSPYTDSSWTKVQTTSEVAIDNHYEPPKTVMETAVTPTSGSTLNFSLPVSSLSLIPQYHIFLHFAELQSLLKNQSRIFNISLNGEDFFPLLKPNYLAVTTVRTLSPEYHAKLDFSIYQAQGSTLPPIINAAETYTVTQPIAPGTDAGDVGAIMDIKRYYNLVGGRNWMGDPCSPKGYLWDGLNCTYSGTQTSRIVSLDLNSAGLVGEISTSIGNLTELQQLDLSMNNLTGPIPDFLGNLQKLKYLNLTGNNLSGDVPKSLQVRASTGALKLSLGNNESPSNPVPEDKKKKSNTWKIVVAIVAAICVVALLLTFIFCVIIKPNRNQKRDSATVQNPEIKSGRQNGHSGNSFRIPSIRAENRPFTYTELIKITNNFNKVIGRGGFGIVYYGELENGRAVAVKMLSQSSAQGPKEFQTEAQLLTRIHHKNLVPLVGYCKDKDHMLLVYEYMGKGSLADHLSEEMQTTNTISWKERLRIAVEAAQGLEYLHKGCKPHIIHRDIKPSNILLSDELEAKIADFGLSRIFLDNEEHNFVSTAVMGTPGYLDPEYSNTSKLNDKSDVYSFGIVILQLITGKPAIIRRPSMINILNWLEPLLAAADLNPIVDPTLNGEYDPNSVWKALEIAMACVAQFSIQRPTMNDVLTLLKDCLEIELARGKKDETIYASFSASGNGSVDNFPTEMSSILNPYAR